MKMRFVAAKGHLLSCVKKKKIPTHVCMQLCMLNSETMTLFIELFMCYMNTAELS